MRCALLGPTPGSRPSSSMRSWTAPSYTVLLHRRTAVRRPGGSEAGQAQAAGHRPHGAGGEVVDGPLGVPDGGEDEVLKRLDVVGVDGGRGDRDGHDVTA